MCVGKGGKELSGQMDGCVCMYICGGNVGMHVCTVVINVIWL